MVYIVSAKRTPVGKFQGGLQSVSAPKLGATVVKSILSETQIKPENINEIIMGQVLTAGVGQAPARQTAIYAGLPLSTEALTIGKVCGSGLKSVMLAAQAIKCGDSHIVVAGGQENMSQAPYIMPDARSGMRLGHKQIIDSMIHDGLWDPYNNMHMGNCGEMCATEYNFTREEQDNVALKSYEKARAAIASSAFKNEITPVTIEGKVTTTMGSDEEPNAADLLKMPSLKPAFDKSGTITAANASKINDGAAAVLMCSEEALKINSLKPIAKIISYATHAQDPRWFTTAPIEAVKKCLKKANLSAEQIDLFEINEAFAVVTMATVKTLNLSWDKVNVNGGAIAIGHPIGASGARILTTLIHALHSRKKKYGMATLCIGGGEAVAMIVEAL
jgi:acetyl-CoA C-acetyltransferase